MRGGAGVCPGARPWHKSLVSSVSLSIGASKERRRLLVTREGNKLRSHAVGELQHWRKVGVVFGSCGRLLGRLAWVATRVPTESKGCGNPFSLEKQGRSLVATVPKPRLPKPFAFFNRREGGQDGSLARGGLPKEPGMPGLTHSSDSGSMAEFPGASGPGDPVPSRGFTAPFILARWPCGWLVLR